MRPSTARGCVRTPLRVLQVAGIVVGHAQAQRVASGARLELGQEFGDVAALRRKRLRAPGVLRVVAQQVAIFFHIRAAARGIDDHRIHLGVFERVNCLARELLGLLLFSRVH